MIGWLMIGGGRMLLPYSALFLDMLLDWCVEYHLIYRYTCSYLEGRSHYDDYNYELDSDYHT